jgi:hypothetical protein
MNKPSLLNFNFQAHSAQQHEAGQTTALTPSVVRINCASGTGLLPQGMPQYQLLIETVQHKNQWR